MSDEVWQRERIESPCVKVCVLNPETGHCIGCLRTGAEIAAWSQMTAKARAEIMAALPDRAERQKPSRRGGRRARHEA
ncbi:MAG: DUF1289 domain-containing protein [Pseudomonadota bacterium]